MDAAEWTGEMTVTYASRDSRSFPVSGTLASSTASAYTSSYTIVKGAAEAERVSGETKAEPLSEHKEEEKKRKAPEEKQKEKAKAH